jgi:hypothetical protein
MNKMYRYFFIFLAFTLQFAITNAFNLDAPQRLTATTGQDNQGSYVDLSWYFQSNNDQPYAFYIYQATKQTQDKKDFQVFGKVKFDPNTNQFTYRQYLQTGTFSFYVTAIGIDGNNLVESNGSNIVTVQIAKDPNKPFIQIVSQPNVYSKIGDKYSYQIKAKTNLDPSCPLVYRLLDGPKDMQIDETNGLITWAPSSNGSFPVAVQVGTTCKIAVDFPVQKFMINVGDVNNGPYVRFESKPLPTIPVGKMYVYQIVASSNVKCPIKFELISNTPNIKFDNVKGELYIYSDVPTMITGGIKAYLECDPKVMAYQQFAIKIVQDQPQEDLCAVIKGNIVLEDGTLPREGKVIAWRLTEKSNKIPAYPGYIKEGKFEVNVPTGAFILEFDSPVFMHEYYLDANSIDKAQKIDVKCKDVVEIDVAVTARPVPKTNSVSGTVTSILDNSPVFAVVEFYPVDPKNNINQKTGMVFQTKTDANGNYSIELTDDMTYRAHCRPMANIPYKDQWYDQVDNPNQADLIYPDQPLTGIDFKLSKADLIKNSFAGSVKDANGVSVRSRILALPVKANPSNNTNAGQFITESKDDGSFMFQNLPYGNYVLLSLPVDRKFLPGYYKSSDFATLKWREATQITVGDNMPAMIYEIKHKLRTGFKGLIRIDGNIIASGMAKKNIDIPQSNGSPVEDALVYIIDEQGEVSDFALTDAAGYFAMSEVSEGNCKLFVDKVGFNTFEKSLTNDYTKSFSSNVDVVLELEVAGVEEEQVVSNLTIYPNPTQNVANIIISGYVYASTQAVVRVVDVMGNIILSKDVNLEFLSAEVRIMTSTMVSLDISSLAHGIYIIEVISGNTKTQTKLNVIR